MDRIPFAGKDSKLAYDMQADEIRAWLDCAGQKNFAGFVELTARHSTSG
jgi:hypothetical protein